MSTDQFARLFGYGTRSAPLVAHVRRPQDDRDISELINEAAGRLRT